jgi:transcription elongation factor GreA
MRTVILKDAYNVLLEKIKELKRDIKQNSRDIARAADFGDISENAEYDAAKERQSELIMNLNNLEAYTKARIIEEKDINTKVISFGTTVRLFDLINNEIATYTLAGPVEFELEIYPAIMTFTSPLGQALIGKKKGDIVDIELPKKKSRFLVLNIEPVASTVKHEPNLVILGHVGYDVISMDGTDKGSFHGGSAYHAGVGAASVSDRFAFVTCLEKTDTELYDSAQALSCSMGGVKIINGQKSPRFNLTYASAGKERDKRMDISLGCAGEISFADLPSDFYKTRFLHLASAPPEQQLRWITEIKNEKDLDCEISIDISESYIKEHKEILCKAAEECVFLFVNEREREILKDMDTEEKVVVVKKADGAVELWIDDELQLEERPLEIEHIDSTGYGSVLAGAFMMMLALGHDEETALTLAIRMASKSTADFGVDHLLNTKSK